YNWKIFLNMTGNSVPNIYLGQLTGNTRGLMPFTAGWGIRLLLEKFNCCAGSIGVPLSRLGWNQRILGNYFMRRKNLELLQVLSLVPIHYIGGMSIFIEMLLRRWTAYLFSRLWKWR